MHTKFVFVTGGVVSGLGKGITAASLGRLLKQRGFKGAAQKLDPYLNVDPGTMSPIQHGEVYVTEDGAETDLDLGHYERFIDEDLNKYSNLTSGKVYWNVLNKERRGEFKGETVQIIPHITDYIRDFIYAGAHKTKADVMLVEIGGTVGDIESQPFIEAIRQISLKHRSDCLFIHVCLIPYLKASEEHKSKPAQHSVHEMQSMGITPNIIVARSDDPIDNKLKKKLALHCNVKEDCVIDNWTLSSLYDAPLMLHGEEWYGRKADNPVGLDTVVCRELGLPDSVVDLTEWSELANKVKSLDKTVHIALVGKYTKLHDAYLSVVESLNHAGFTYGTKVKIDWVDSEALEALSEEDRVHKLKNAHGILVPGGFGERGIEGMIWACKYARENNIPYLGLCLGMQIASIEFARNVCGLKDAHSSEFQSVYPSTNHVIHLMPGQKGKELTGGTLRLGAFPCHCAKGTLLHKLYGKDVISERHRHRYEFNDKYRDTITKHGLVLSGTCPADAYQRAMEQRILDMDDKTEEEKAVKIAGIPPVKDYVVEAVELPSHKFFIGVQYHPEFKSRPNKPHPLFIGFVEASLNK